MTAQIKKLLRSRDKRLKLVFVLGMAGILLILISDILPKKSTTDETVSEQLTLDETELYKQDIERQLTEVISHVSGAGRTRVMISVTGTKEYVYAEKSDLDRRTEGTGESYRSQGEIVLADGGGEKQPVLRKVSAPQIGGAAVICEGASDPQVRERVMNVVSAVLGLPPGRISVQPSA